MTDIDVDELYLWSDNTGELYPYKMQILANPGVYEKNLAPLIWRPYAELAAEMYVHEIVLNRPLSTFSTKRPNAITVNRNIPVKVREDFAKALAKHERDLLMTEQEYGPSERDKEGVQAIIALQKLDGKTETQDSAWRGWNKLSVSDKDKTIAIYRTIFRGRSRTSNPQIS